MLCTGYVILYAVFPVLWCSKLRTEIDLSTIEVEYIVLIQMMPKVIPFMELMRKVSIIFDINIPKPEVFCKVFEENQSCISSAESKKSSSRTKHICINYHNLSSFVKKYYPYMLYWYTRTNSGHFHQATWRSIIRLYTNKIILMVT